MKAMLRTTLPLLTLLLAFALPAAPAAAQEPEGGFGEELEVSEVLLDVIVTNRQGDVIVGLGPEDFRVTEGGEPVDLSEVTFYSSSVPEETAAAMAEKGVEVDRAPEDRYFILFFDDQRKHQTDVRTNLVQRQLQAGRDAAEWVRSSLAPADWVAVVGYDRSLDVYTDFTRDRQRIAEAVRKAAAGAEGLGNWPSRQKDEGPSLLDDLPEGRDLVEATTRIYSALTEVAEAAGDVRGRKNLVYLGLGFGRLNTFGQYEEDQRYYPGLVQALNDNNVAVYTVDVTPSGVSHAFESALSNLAADTGGRYFPFFTSFSTPLSEVAQETGGYYLLAYTARHPAGEKGFQRVEVDTVNPEFRVRARQGYLF
jgi:VWFA-related protein